MTGLAEAMSRLVSSLMLLLAVAMLLSAAPDQARATSSQAVGSQTDLTAPTSQSKPPPEHELSPRQARAIAKRSRKIEHYLAGRDNYTVRAFAKGPGRWQVSWYDAGKKEIAQAIVDERKHEVVEAWTGPQVAWQMARGLPGAFGRKASAVYVWVPLMALFLFCLLDWRRLIRIEHLDLLALLSFSASQYFFNKGDIDTSVPLVYPTLAYILARMLMIGYARRSDSNRRAWRPSIPAAYLALLLIFLVGFRIGLNVTNSNVIDVGYSGVVGADRVTHAVSPYGNFPSDDPSGDTYGPVTYYTYVPFEEVFPWHGHWDDLPAAHGAAILFDLATIAGLLLLGRRMRRDRQEGWSLGIVLAFAWASFPYTLYAMNSNANDSLVAALLVVALIAASRPRARGVTMAFAGAAKFVALAVVPVFATFDRRRARDALAFGLLFLAVSLILWLPLLPDGGLRELYDRTVGFQLGRGSPFSIWGQHPGLEPVQTAVKVAAAGLALFVAWLPRKKDLVQLAALSAALLIALQLSLTHWFYLYIVWWLPLALVALLTQAPSPARSTRQGHPVEPAPSSP